MVARRLHCMEKRGTNESYMRLKRAWQGCIEVRGRKLPTNHSKFTTHISILIILDHFRDHNLVPRNLVTTDVAINARDLMKGH